MSDRPAELAQAYQSFRRTGLITRLLVLARDEDLGPSGRDVTSESLIDADARMRCQIVSREPGVVAGLAVLDDLLQSFGCSETVRCETLAADGDVVESRQPIATLDGNARAILTLERTLLNIIGRLSGIATLTRRYVLAIGRDTHARLYDTRKTTPGLRVLEKYAVLCGGGYSHRLGLYDMILVKDNHLTAQQLARLPERIARSPYTELTVEIEVDSLDQLAQVLAFAPGTCNIVLLDNFSIDQLRQAVRMRQNSAHDVLLEASGGVTLQTIRDIAETGVDRISVGALTHSAGILDFGLDAM